MKPNTFRRELFRPSSSRLSLPLTQMPIAVLLVHVHLHASQQLRHPGELQHDLDTKSCGRGLIWTTIPAFVLWWGGRGGERARARARVCIYRINMKTFSQTSLVEF
jgi:hypothetical protein